MGNYDLKSFLIVHRDAPSCGGRRAFQGHLKKDFKICGQFYEHSVPNPGWVGSANAISVGGAVAEWSKVLQMGEKINKNQKIPVLPPNLGNL